MYKMQKISSKPLTEEDLRGFDATGIVLPGFVENGVTYESHTFTVHLGRRNFGIVHWSNEAEKKPRVQEAIIHVRHGGGHEAWRVNHMLACTLDAMLAAVLTREAYFLCWAAMDIYRDCINNGREGARADYFKAFVDGRLKKRKRVGQSAYKVWVEPETLPVQPRVQP